MFKEKKIFDERYEQWPHEVENILKDIFSILIDSDMKLGQLLHIIYGNVSGFPLQKQIS